MLRTLLLVTLAVLSITVNALAQDEAPAPSAAALAEARHSFGVATRAFEEEDYATAVSEFRTAYELSHAPDLLFNIYLAEERAGDLEVAADALAEYLERGTIEAEQRELLEGRLTRLRARIAAHTPAPAVEEPQLLLASPIAPMPEPVVEPVAEPEPEPAPAPAPAPPAGGGGGPPAAAIGVLVAAGVFAIGFGVFAALSEVEDQRLASSCGRDAGRFCAVGAGSTLFAYDVAADVGWIGAATLGVIDLVLWLALPAEGAAPTGASARVRPWGGRDAGGLTLLGAF